MKKRTKLSRPYQAWVVVLCGRAPWPLMATVAAQKKISISQAEKYFGMSWDDAQSMHHSRLDCIKVTLS